MGDSKKAVDSPCRRLRQCGATGVPPGEKRNNTMHMRQSGGWSAVIAVLLAMNLLAVHEPEAQAQTAGPATGACVRLGGDCVMTTVNTCLIQFGTSICSRTQVGRINSGDLWCANPL